MPRCCWRTATASPPPQRNAFARWWSWPFACEKPFAASATLWKRSRIYNLDQSGNDNELLGQVFAQPAVTIGGDSAVAEPREHFSVRAPTSFSGKQVEK